MKRVRGNDRKKERATGKMKIPAPFLFLSLFRFLLSPSKTGYPPFSFETRRVGG